MRPSPPSTTLTELEQLILNLRGTISRQDHQDNILARMRVVALNDLQRRLLQIRRLTAQRHLKLAFIGPVGVGKTTIICDLLGLRYQDGKAGEVGLRNVLTTSAGRTTSCEVQILVRDAVRFDVQYHDDGDFRVMLEAFCLQHWKLAGHSVDDDVDQSASETLKVIRNLVGLKQDAATTLAETFTTFAAYFEEVLARYHTQDRTQTELVYSGGVDGALAWIASHFKKLNIGTLEGFSLPKSIAISIPRSLLRIPDDIYLDSVVDTKGLEAEGPARQDIDQYVSGGEYLCMFVDHFKSAPNSVIPTLRGHLHRESLDTEQRCLLLVNTMQGEAAASMDDDGEYTSVDDGHAIKADQIRTAMSGAKIFNFLDHHVCFYDPHEHFSSKQEFLTLKQGARLEDAKTNPDQVWQMIGDALLGQNEYFRTQTDALKKRILSLESNGTIDPTDLDRIRFVHTNITRLSADFRPAVGSLRSWLGTLGNIHVSTFRGINNRYGIFSSHDIYYIAGDVSEQFFRNTTEKHKLDIERALQDLRASVSNQELRDCLGQFVDKLNADYQEAAKAARLSSRQFAEAKIHPTRSQSLTDTETFWGDVHGRWGGGPGYRDDVVSMYRDQLSASDAEEPKQYQRAWEKHVTLPLLENLSVQ